MMRMVLRAALVAGMLLGAVGGPAWSAADDDAARTFAIKAMNAKTSIDLALSGEFGRDYVVEPVFSDPRFDAHVVIYLSDAVEFSMAHNATNTRQYCSKKVPFDGGDIRFQLDGAPTFNKSFYQSPVPFPGVFDYEKPFALKGLEYEPGLPVVGGFGPAGEELTDEVLARDALQIKLKHYWRGLRGPDGDEWHALLYWDLDPKADRGHSHSSDGKVAALVVNPKVPAILVHAPEGEQFYTTPPKVYGIPKIHERTTYLTDGVTLRLFGMGLKGRLEYRVGGEGAWRPYEAPLVARELVAPEATPVLFECRAGNGAVRRRTLVRNPGYPSATEKHPRMMFSSDEDLVAQRERVRSDILYQHYSKGLPGVLQSGIDYGDGLRHDHSHWSQPQVLEMAFVAAVEGYGDEVEAYTRYAKIGLMDSYSLDPVGCHAQGTPVPEWWAYVGGLRYAQFAAAAYDLLAGHYTVANGHKDGMTPIEDLLIRDHMAREAISQLRANAKGGGLHGGHWQDCAIAAIAMAMPGYDTPYLGTSGADGRTKATHLDAPFPHQKITWWQYHTDPKIETPGYPDLAHISMNFLTYDQEDGTWKADAKTYHEMHTWDLALMLHVRLNFDGHLYGYMKAYFDQLLYTRHPNSGHSYGFQGGQISMGRLTGAIRTLVNPRIEDADVYAWSLENPLSKIGGTGYWPVHAVAYHPEIESRRPQEGSRFGKWYAFFAGDIADAKTVSGRLTVQAVEVPGGRPYNRPRGPFRHDMEKTESCADNMRLDIDAYGEYLLVNQAGADRHTRPCDALNGILTGADRAKGADRLSVAYTANHQRFGVSTLTEKLQGPLCDYACASSRRDLSHEGWQWDRHVLFLDKKFFVLADQVRAGEAPETVYGLVLQGSSDGSAEAGRFDVDEAAGSVRWTKASGVSLTARVVGPPVGFLRETRKIFETGQDKEPAVVATARGTDVLYLTVLYPADKGQQPATITPIAGTGCTAATVDDGQGRWIVLARLDSGPMSAGGVEADGQLAWVKLDGKGDAVFAAVSRGSRLTVGGKALIAEERQGVHTFRAER